MIRAVNPIHIARRVVSLVFADSLYLFWVPEFGYYQRVKFGISNSPKWRLQSVRAETGLNARVLAHFPIPLAKTWEQGLLYATRKLRVSMPFHSGHTEWRKSFNAVTAVIGWLFMWAFGVDNAGFIAFIILAAPLPIDAGLLFLITVLLSYAFLGAVIWAAYWFIQVL